MSGCYPVTHAGRALLMQHHAPDMVLAIEREAIEPFVPLAEQYHGLAIQTEDRYPMHPAVPWEACDAPECVAVLRVLQAMRAEA